VAPHRNRRGGRFFAAISASGNVGIIMMSTY